MKKGRRGPSSSDEWQKTMYDETLARETLASREYARIADVEAEFLIRAMGLSPGETLLDIPCGTGRHARVFAKRGLRVTGVDISAECIRMAKRSSGSKAITYEKGNLANLKGYRGQFDAVVNLFTSFGYFSSEAKNFRALKEMVGALKPGGRIALHLIDRDWLLKHFQANTWSERKGIFTLEARQYDPRTKRIESRSVLLDRKTEKAKSYFHETRLYTKPEMIKLLKAVGLKSIQVYGDTDGALYRKGESSHPLYIAWKPAKT